MVPVGLLPPPQPTVATLQQLIGRHAARQAGDAALGQATLRFGVAAIDTHLGGGLSCRALHEFAPLPAEADDAASATRLLALLLAGDGRAALPVLWVCARRDLYPPGLAGTGFDPTRLIVAETTAAHIPAVMEEGLRHASLAAVVGETGTPLSLTASRRLHLAAEKLGRPALLLRRFRIGQEPSAAVTRWRIGAVPPARPPPRSRADPWLDPPCLRLDLLRCRGATPASWTLLCHDETDRPPGHTSQPHRLAVAAALADGPLAPRHAAYLSA